MIKIDNLSFEYRDTRALNNVSLKLEQGTITALVGPNGAGKTTLFKTIAALEKPFQGSIILDGVDVIRNPKECHQRVGFLPDFFGLYDGLTVLQSLQFFGSLAGFTEDKISTAVTKVSKRLWLDELLHKEVKTLSRGMRQRLAIAQIVIKEPQVLLLDEPASGLDPGARNELNSLFKTLKDDGMTLLVSSHILSELEQYADRLVIMRKGEIISEGTEQHKENKALLVSVSLLSDPGKLLDFLNGMPEVSVVSFEKNEVCIKVDGDDKKCGLLLKNLIDNNFSLYEFKILKEDMQSKYTSALSDQGVTN